MAARSRHEAERRPGAGRLRRAIPVAAQVPGLAHLQEELAGTERIAVRALGIVRLDDVAATLAATPPSTPDVGLAAAPGAPSPQSVAPAAAGPPPLHATPVLGLRIRQLAATPIARYATLVFLLAALFVVAVAAAFDRNARSSSWREHTTSLAAAAHVGAASFDSLRASLSMRATELATSLPLQRAVVRGDGDELRRIAGERRARIDHGGRSIGTLPPEPRIESTAKVANGVRVLATVTIALPLGEELLTLLRRATPLPRDGSLLLAREGSVLAGGPAGAAVRIREGRLVLGGKEFAAQSAPLRAAGATLVAVEPVAALDAVSERYRRFVFLAAALTLVLAAALASRLARPIVHAVGDVARLTRQASTDALTGLANRHELAARLEDELERASRNGTSVSFVIADLDDFKSINDEHGHQTGDAILREVAVVLTRSIRGTDLAVRFGGEEFVLVLPGAKLVHARRAADTIRTALTAIRVAGRGDEEVGVTASFGVAEYPTYSMPDALLAAADAALYQAKRAGKNRVATSTVEGAPAPAGAAPVS